MNKIVTNLGTFEEDDHKYFLRIPEEGFSPEKNQVAIQKAIDSGMKIEMDLRKASKKEIEYRSDVLTSYAMHQANTGSSKRFEKYMGKQHMARIYGEKLMQKIKIMESVQRLNKANGNTMLGGAFYLT